MLALLRIADSSGRLSLGLEDAQRPLPDQAGKWFADAVGSVFQTAGLGYFGSSGAVGRADGSSYTELFYSVDFKGDLQRAIGFIRETLWWMEALENTSLDISRLSLGEPPAVSESRFLQLAAPKVERWEFDGKPAHRIDHCPFSKAQRDGIRHILADYGVKHGEGWTDVATP